MDSVEKGIKESHDWQKFARWSIFFPLGLLLLVWLLNTPPGLLGKADAVGYAVCHRIDGRSFHLGERQLPLCARCSGMYLGAMLGLLFQARLGRRSGTPPKRVLFVLALLVLAFGVDGLNSYLYLFLQKPLLYTPQNLLRLLTGTGMGLVIAAAIYPAFQMTIWKRIDRRPALEGLISLGILFSLAFGLDLLVLSENPLVLYPLALLSALSVLVILTMIYSLVWVMLFKLENRFLAFRQLTLPLAGGFAIGLAQIAVLDLVRFLLTGTWDGFHIG